MNRLIAPILLPIAAFVLLGVCVINIGVIVCLKPRIRAVAPAVHQLPMMLKVAKAICRLELNAFAHEQECLRERREQPPATEILRLDG